jgi:hypothetical protein
MRALRPLLPLIVVLVGWLVSVPSVLAQAPKKASGGHGRAKSDPSKALVDQALAALESKDFPTATALLTSAYRSAPRPELLYQLGRVAMAAGRTLEAHDLLRRYLADPAREPDETATKLAEDLVAAGPPDSGSLSIQSDPGALVWVDDRVVGSLPLPLPVLLSPGSHNVLVEFSGKKLEAPVQIRLSRLTEVRMSRASGAVLISVLPAILLWSEQAGVPVDSGRALSDAVEQAARSEQYTMLSIARLLRKESERSACVLKDDCLRELGKTTQAEWLLKLRLVVTGEPKRLNWQIGLQLLRLDIVEPAAETELTCSSCDAEQVSAKLKEAAAKLLGEGLLRPFGSISVLSEPIGAKVQLGVRSAQATPFRLTLWKGRYGLQVRHPNYREQQQDVEIDSGSPAELVLRLEPLRGESALPGPGQPLPPLVRPPRPKWRLALGGTMIGLGGALLAVGGTGIALDGQCVSPVTVEGAACSTLNNTRPVGSFSLLSGLALMISGTVLIALPERRR